jgi:hypothetical protein
VSLSARDKKILIVLVPVLAIAAYWLLVLGPKRADAGRLGDELAQQEQRRDDAVAEAGQLDGAKANYAKDYETVVSLGKAIPSSVDMPSLIVQLDRAARGTGIRFNRIKTGERVEAPPPPPPGGKAASGEGTPAAAPGGESAGTAPGKAAESAGNTAATANEQSGATGADASGAGSSAAGGGSTSGVPGLDSVPLEFTFKGSFFDLADFFHQLKRFVHSANGQVRVSGRLLTIDGMSFESSAFPTITAEVRATVYLSPKNEGVNAGGSAAGPQQAASPGGTGGAPAPSPAPAAAPPAATVGSSR